jgi:hypothetical protein
MNYLMIIVIGLILQLIVLVLFPRFKPEFQSVSRPNPGPIRLAEPVYDLGPTCYDDAYAFCNEVNQL